MPIMLLVPIRQYLMPRIFRREHLRELDAMEEELAPPLPHQQALQVRRWGKGFANSVMRG